MPDTLRKGIQSGNAEKCGDKPMGERYEPLQIRCTESAGSSDIYSAPRLTKAGVALRMSVRVA